MIAAQQSLWESAPLFDRHANAGAAVQKRTATNINNALLLRIAISGQGCHYKNPAIVYRATVIYITY
jgi:hypothetical protein